MPVYYLHFSILSVYCQYVVSILLILQYTVCVLSVYHLFCLQVQLDRLALDKEKQMLEDENRKLKTLLKQYLDGKGWAHTAVFAGLQGVRFTS